METQNMEIAQICEQGSLGNNPRQPRQKAEADSAKKQANNIDNNKERKKERKKFFQKAESDKKENLDFEKNQVPDFAVNGKKVSQFKEKGRISHNVYTLCDPRVPHANTKIQFRNEE